MGTNFHSTRAAHVAEHAEKFGRSALSVRSSSGEALQVRV